MADERLRIKIEADAARAEQDLKNIAELGDELTDDELSIVVAMKSEAAEANLKSLLKQMQSAEDPVDLKVLTVGVKQATDEIERLARTAQDLPPLDLKTSAAVKGLDDVQRSADGSRSVLANMIGNTTQDLGALGGVAGSAGVAIGQMGEYMADAKFSGEGMGSVIKNFAGVLGPVVALSVGVAAATAAWKAYNAKSKETARLTKELSGALSNQTGVMDDIKASVGDGADAWSLLNKALATNEKEFPKVAAAMGKIGKNTDSLSKTLADVEDNAAGALGELAAGAGIPRQYAAAIGEAVAETESFAAARQQLIAHGVNAAIVDEYENEIRAIEEINDAQQNWDLDTAAREQLDLAASVDTATAALVDQARADVGVEAGDLAAWERFVDLQNQAEGGARLFKAGVEGAAGIIGDTADKLRDQAAAHEEARAAAEEHLGLFKTYADAVLARTDAEKDLATTLEDSKSTMEDQRDAILDVATARVEEKKLAEEASGRTFDEVDAVDELNWQLLNMAKGLEGPTAQALGNYIANLNGIPEEEATAILTLIDEGKFDEAATRLAEVSTSRDVAIVADATTAPAKAELDTLTLPRTVQVDVVARGLDAFTRNVTNAVNNALGGRTQQSTAARYVWRNGRYVEVG